MRVEFSSSFSTTLRLERVVVENLAKLHPPLLGAIFPSARTQPQRRAEEEKFCTQSWRSTHFPLKVLVGGGGDGDDGGKQWKSPSLYNVC